LPTLPAIAEARAQADSLRKARRNTCKEDSGGEIQNEVKIILHQTKGDLFCARLAMIPMDGEIIEGIAHR
jgi:high-affinity K+ transport system ATPase subunit B